MPSHTINTNLLFKLLNRRFRRWAPILRSALPFPEMVQFREDYSAFTRFASEESERFISCHPELAKDLTTHRPALCQRLLFSKLRALLGMPSVSNSLEVDITSVRLREILRKLPMNLPVARGRWEARSARSFPGSCLGMQCLRGSSLTNAVIGHPAKGGWSLGGQSALQGRSLVTSARGVIAVLAQQSPSRFGEVSSSG